MSDDARSNEALAHSAAGGLRWVTLARVGSELILVVSMVWLARLVPPSAFGMFAVAVLVQEIAMNVPSEGIGNAIVQRRGIGRAHLQAGLFLALGFGLVLAAFTVALALLVVDPLVGAGTAHLMLLLAPLCLVGALMAVPGALLRRRLDFRSLSILELIGSTGRSLASVFFAAVLGLDGSALALGVLTAATIVLVVSMAMAPSPLPRYRREPARELLAYAGPASLSVIAWTGFRNCDYAIIAARLGPAQAGFYWRGFQLAVEYQRKVTSVMSYFGFPVLARTESVDDLLALRRRMVRLTTVTLFPVFTTLAIVAPVAIPWLLGPDWEPAVLPTQILTAAGAATILTDNVGAALMALGRARTLLFFGAAHFGVYAVAVLIASRWGIAGVCVAAVVVHGAFLVIAYERLLAGRPEKPLAVLLGDVSAAGASCAALAAVALPLELALRESGTATVPHLAIVCAVAAAVYLGTLRALFADAWGDLATLLRKLLPAPRRTAPRVDATPERA